LERQKIFLFEPFERFMADQALQRESGFAPKAQLEFIGFCWKKVCFPGFLDKPIVFRSYSKNLFYAFYPEICF